MRSVWNKKPVTYDIDDKGCHLCTSHSTSDGYPQFRRGDFKGLICRYVLQEKLGRPILKGYCALHTCNNRKCINPEHIYEGTQLENMKDSLNAGTANCLNMVGEKCPWSKLTEEDVKYIRSHPWETQRSLAKKYGVSATVVWRARRGLAWKNISGEGVTV